MASATEWTFLKASKKTLPAGLYWIGDLCYILPEDVYDTSFGSTGYQNGFYTHSKGGCFFVASTYAGDGVYEGSDGFKYPVDAGVLSIVSANLIEKSVPSLPPGQKQGFSMGTLYHFSAPVECDFTEKGVFRFTTHSLSLVIDTTDWEEEEGEEEGYEWEENAITGSMLKKMAKHDNLDLDLADFQNMLWTDKITFVERLVELGFFTPRHGDAFHWLGKGYRNENLLFWHKDKKVMFPYTEIDDYGSVPPDFRVGNGEDEFEPTHWSKVVDHNSIIFLSDGLVEDIKKAMKPATTGFTALVEIKGEPYKVVLKSKSFKGLPWASVDNHTLFFKHFG